LVEAFNARARRLFAAVRWFDVSVSIVDTLLLTEAADLAVEGSSIDVKKATSVVDAEGSRALLAPSRRLESVEGANASICI
jgi:hypothetical protein